MGRGIFVTGTDTGAGKTVVSAALLNALRARDRTAVGMKPVASGCEWTAAGWRNEDALMLMAESSVQAPYELVNPYAFEPPIAPHLAAATAGRDIEPGIIQEAYSALARQAQWTVVEGVGGWQVPLGAAGTVADLARALELPVLLVVGLRLGCLNHALLTAESIGRSGLPLAGWIGSLVEPGMQELEGNLKSLKGSLGAPCLGVVPFGATEPDAASRCLDIETLLRSVER